MSKACPWCLEPLVRGEREAAECPLCGRPLRDEGGRPVRLVDVRSGPVEAAQRRRFLRMLQFGTPSVAAVCLLLPLLHLTGLMLAAVPVLVVAHLGLVRLLLFREALPLLGPHRRFLHRWLGRLAFLWLGGGGYALAAIPVAGALAGGAVFAGLTSGYHYYTLWSLRRERERLSPTWWEIAVLVALAMLTLAVLGAILVVALAMGWAIHRFL